MGDSEASSAGDAPEPRRGTVFFVDDDDRLRTVTCRLLKARGFEVLEAESAERALDVLEKYEDDIHVVLMDINLPDGWGASVAQRLRDVRPNMAVVFTTGYADVDPILASALNDAEFVVKKPFSTEQLVEILERAIGGESEESPGDTQAV
ncbi:MAG: response regulator [Gemmatimonadota bacterium]|nr:response regulator [Gemmatimonadota bacterium]